jgi:tellurite methyltransferase
VNPSKSVDFFDTQFRKQVAAGDFALNPFETACLPFIHGRVLDFGCGLGNLAVAAARRGLDVTAVDASAAAIAHIRAVATAEQLRITAQCADIGSFAIHGQFDTIAAIGLLMFFPREKAFGLLSQIQAHVADGGTVVVNTLIEGTTYMGMFEPGHYHLFGKDELRDLFAGWKVLHFAHDDFAAPGGTTKAFATIVAQKKKT